MHIISQRKLIILLIILIVAIFSLYIKTLFDAKHNVKKITGDINQINIKVSDKLKQLKGDLITQNTDFYENLSIYLTNNDSLDLGQGDTINFEIKEDCLFDVGVDFEVTNDGSYVICTDYPSKFIAMYSKYGKFITKFGREGEGPGEYKSPIYVEIRRDTYFVMTEHYIK